MSAGGEYIVGSSMERLRRAARFSESFLSVDTRRSSLACDTRSSIDLDAGGRSLSVDTLCSSNKLELSPALECADVERERFAREPLGVLARDMRLLFCRRNTSSDGGKRL